MKQITVYKDSVITNGPAQFETESELQKWFNDQEEMGTFRTKEKQVVTTDFEGNETVEVLPITHTFVIEDKTAEIEAAAALAAKVEAGKKARDVCQQVLDYISGCNLEKELSLQQISDMQVIYKNAEAALRSGRPTFAKNFISVIEPDGIMVTEEEKSQCLLLLAGY